MKNIETRLTDATTGRKRAVVETRPVSVVARQLNLQPIYDLKSKRTL